MKLATPIFFYGEVFDKNIFQQTRYKSNKPEGKGMQQNQFET